MIREYRELLNDKRRVIAFRKAIQELTNRDTTIAEIGTALGTYAFFAAMAGAKKVYAIEEKDIIEVAKVIAKRNSLEDRIVFIKGHSTSVELPEKADYIIMEDYTPIFLYPGLKDVILDARERFLKAGGKFIPEQIDIKMAACQFFSFHTSLDLWRNTNDILYDINWDHTTEMIFNQPHYVEQGVPEILTEEILIKSIKLSSENDFIFSFDNEVEIKKDSILHGIVGWWDCFFTPTQYFTNSPKESPSSWGQMFFPFRHPVQVRAGEKVHLYLYSIESKNTGEIHFKWGIETENSTQDYNTFKSVLFSLDQLQKNLHADHPPTLSKKGEILKNLLNNVNGINTITDLKDLASKSGLTHFEINQIFKTIFPFLQI
ncbi:MAG: hypothetical protein DRP91_02720 [Candidatus Neomarinimicrobiota bacterium]|mgnify:CR=1 FL=1|nr:hypothetical protein [Candidatus Neomarinimicrobiota bacterium]RKY50050.1 MAG: hypothetical protein DRP91_02720 [Candidatus Neomarinimicrobiota bacterium]RKY53944.1 MAG: hypothetical protein DRP92_02335 [Candidatus Neomarinimicrobiota bacterium]